MKKSRSKRAESPSELIDAKIEDLGDWRGEMLSRLRGLIKQADPEVVEAKATPGGAAWNRGCDSTMHVLSLLREMGLDPASDEARRAVGRVCDRVTDAGQGRPSRWNTLRALRVLDWHSARA